MNNLQYCPLKNFNYKNSTNGMPIHNLNPLTNPTPIPNRKPNAKPA